MAGDVREQRKAEMESSEKEGKRRSSNVPSYVLVQKQIHDLVNTQRSVVEQLQDELTQHISFASSQEDSISIEEHEKKLQEFEAQLLKKYVPRMQYDDAVQKLEAEKAEHGATKAALREAQDKLDYALNEAEILRKQLEREKASFQMAFGSLQTKAKEVSNHRKELETKVSAIHQVVQKQEKDLGCRDDEIRVLQRKLEQQKQLHQKRLAEVEVERQQENYISQMLGEKKSKGSTATSSTASSK